MLEHTRSCNERLFTWRHHHQFTAAPPCIVDLTGDGKSEVFAVANSELGGGADCGRVPYVSQQRVLFAAGGTHIH